MWENMKFKADRSAGSYLAAYFILSLGLVACSTLILLIFTETPHAAGVILGAGGCLLIASLFLRRVDLPTNALRGIFGRRRPLINDEYVPRLRRPRSLEFGTNRPPTVEDVREAGNNGTTWVPHGSISGRRSVREGNGRSLTGDR